MTVAVVQHKIQANPGVSGSITLTSTPGVGNLLVAVVGWRGATSPPSILTGFTEVAEVNSVSAGLDCVYMAYRISLAGDTATFTHTATSSKENTIQLTEYSGSWSSPVGTFATGTAGGVHPQVTITPTAGSNGVVVLGAINADTNTPADTNYVAGAGYTLLDQANTVTNHPVTGAAYKIVGSTAGSYSPDMTATSGYPGDGSASTWGAIAAMFTTTSVASPGIWIDWSNDGFGDGSGSSVEVGYLAMDFPEGGTTVSDNITTDCISIDIDQGGTAEVTGGSGTDTCTIVVKNSTGKYSPDNSASTVYGKLKPGRRVWIGVNADGTLSGTGQTIYGLFAGKVREIAPIPVGGASAPTTEIICDGIVQDYQTPVRVADSTARSQYDYRVAVLDAIGESATRRSLAVEPDTLPLSSADSTSALSVLDDLNHASGTRHYIAADSDKDVWYKYTTRNRQYKFGAAADATIDAGAQHLTAIDSWRYNNDTIENSARASIDPVNFPFAIAQVWTYNNVPFSLAGNKTIWADFSDYVRSPILTVTSSGAAVTSSMTSFGHSAKIDLSSSGATISNIKITGQQVIREQGVSLTADDLASQAAYGVRSASDLSGPLLGASASAQGIVDHLVYRYGSRPLKRPKITTHNWLASAFSLNLYDQIAVTLAAVSATAVKFEILGRTIHCDLAASASTLDWIVSFQLGESRIQGTQAWFTLNTSTLGGTDPLGY